MVAEPLSQTPRNTEKGDFQLTSLAPWLDHETW